MVDWFKTAHAADPGPKLTQGGRAKPIKFALSAAGATVPVTLD